MHVTIPLSTPFNAMGAISKASIWRSDAQLAAKWPHVESTSTDAASASRLSSSSAPPSGVEASLTTIMDQLQLMRANFGSCLDHLSDEMCQMNTKIGRIARHQSRLGGFAPSPTPKPVEVSSSDGGDDDDTSSSEIDDEMATSQ